jgi:hypothetical protein
LVNAARANPLRADLEPCPLHNPYRAAPPLRAPWEHASQDEKSVTRLLCPQRPFQGGRRSGKPLCWFPGRVGWACSGVKLQTGEARGLVSCGRQGTPGRSRPHSPQQLAHFRLPPRSWRPRRSGCARCLERTGTGRQEGPRGPQRERSCP